MLVGRSSLLWRVRGRNLRLLCAGSDQTVQDKDATEMKILKESIERTVEKNPDLAVAPSEQDVSKTRSAFTSFSPSSTDLTAYDKLQLSKDNMVVDTYALIKVFTEQGFTIQQAESITYTFTHILNDALREQRKRCVEKDSLEVMREQMMARLESLRKDMIILEKSELSSLRNEVDKLKMLMTQHKNMTVEDVNKVRNQLTLDINIERSRVKDEQAAIERSIAALNNALTAEQGRTETKFERSRNDLYRLIGGASFTVVVSGVLLLVRSYVFSK